MESIKIVIFIAGHEGKVSQWYLDPTGTPSIGFGFTWASKVFRDWWMRKYGRKMRRGDIISDADALSLLKVMLQKEYFPPVFEMFKAQPINVREAGGSFTYNAGNGALRWKWATAIARGDLAEGARRWRQTAVTSKGLRLAGLVRRRREEADIAEYNLWPEQAKERRSNARSFVKDDVLQAQKWLETLGFNPGPIDGIEGPKTRDAVFRFQRKHPDLIADGALGTATMSALQRAFDLKTKMVKTVGSGGAVAAPGVAVEGLGFWGDALLWGGLAIAVAGSVWLAWRYRTEIKLMLERL